MSLHTSPTSVDYSHKYLPRNDDAHTIGSCQSSRVSTQPPVLESEVSPFERLPVEIKVEIFSRCITPHSALNANGALILLCGVCSSWRALILFTPKLWSSFGVDVPPPGPDSLSQTFHMQKAMDTWLSRSKKYPLSIRICHDPVGRVPDTRSAKFIAALIPHADRWRDIHLSIPNSSIAPLQHSLPLTFRALRSLTLDVRACWASYPPLDIHALGIPWGQLTDLCLRLDSNPLTLDHCMDILAKGTNLVRCSLNADCALNLRGGRRDKIALASMESFELILLEGSQGATEAPETCLFSFLEQLEFGRLRKLGIDSLVLWGDAGIQHWHEVHPRFVSLLGSLSASLEALRVAYLPLSEDQILDGLRMLPKLVDLDLRFSLADREHDPISNSLLHTLTLQSRPSHQSFHQLETIHIQCSGARFNTPVLLGFVHSRWTSLPGEKMNKKLKAFKFVSLRPVGKLARQRVKTWGDEGLDITIYGIDVR